jgi:hypothetical protein
MIDGVRDKFSVLAAALPGAALKEHVNAIGADVHTTFTLLLNRIETLEKQLKENK